MSLEEKINKEILTVTQLDTRSRAFLIDALFFEKLKTYNELLDRETDQLLQQLSVSKSSSEFKKVLNRISEIILIGTFEYSTFLNTFSTRGNTVQK